MPAVSNTDYITQTDRQAGGNQPDASTPTGSGPSGYAFTGTVDLAKLTALGTQGTLTVVNGLITAYTAPT